MVRSILKPLCLVAGVAASAAAVAQPAAPDMQAALQPGVPAAAPAMRQMPPPVPPMVMPTVGIIGGDVDGTFTRVAADLASVAGSDTLRVVPILGTDSTQNIDDLLNLRGVDLALVDIDVLNHAVQRNQFPGLAGKVQYIAKLYDTELHILTRSGIHRIEDLDGQPVSIGPVGSGTSLTSAALFGAARVKPRLVHEDAAHALERLKRGELAAVVFAEGKPVPILSSIPAGSGLHLLPVPLEGTLVETHLPATITRADYPSLVGENQTVDTIASGVVLIAFNWPMASERHRNLSRFVDAFFSRFSTLLRPPYHPKWHEVNLSAQLPGWQRYQPAAEWLARHSAMSSQFAASPLQSQFDAFLAKRGANLSVDERVELFRGLQDWLAQRR